MPSPLEDRVRDARPSPPATTEPRRLAARRAVIEAHATGRSRRRRGLRLLRPALGGLGVAAVVALVGLLLVAGPKGGDDPSGLRFAGRSEEGTALRLSVEPTRPGQSAAQAAEGAASVIRARAAALGVSGLEAVPGVGGTLQMWVPESAPKGALETLLDPARLSFSNLARVLLNRNFATARAALRPPHTNRLRLPGATFYVVDPLTGALLGGPAPTRRAAEEDAGPRTSRQVMVEPPGVLLVRDLVEGGWRMIGEGPAVGGAGIVRVEPAPGGIRAILSSPMPPSLGNMSPHAPELVLLVDGGARPVPELTGWNRDSDRPLTGARSVLFSVPEALRPRVVALFTAGELPARVRVDARATTGG